MYLFIFQFVVFVSITYKTYYEVACTYVTTNVRRVLMAIINQKIAEL